MKYKATTEGKKKHQSYPSQHGSHKTMLSKDPIHITFNKAKRSRVICEDSHGCYVTDRKCLDNGLTDYNRSVNIKDRSATFDHFILLRIYKEAVEDLVPMNAPA